MRFRNIVIPVLLTLFTFGVYIHNLSPSVYGGDVGDFVTSSFVGGVAHAPGYPLFTLLGFLLTRMPFFSTPAFAVGIISVLSGVFGVLFFFLTIRLLTKNTAISLLSSLILAFSYLFWFYNEIAEVFALNNFFFILLLYLAVKISIQKSLRLIPLFFFVLGLSITNHQTIVLAFPTFFVLIIPFLFSLLKKKKFPLRYFFYIPLTFLLGFSVYLYVFIASSQNPIINWDTVHNVSSFLHLILRKDYGTFSAGMFVPPSIQQRLVTLQIYLREISLQLTIPVVFMSIVGLFYAFKKYRLISIALLLAFLLTGPLFIAYAGFPLTGNFYFGVYERFFILSSLIMLYFFPFGILLLSVLFERSLKRNAILLQCVFFIIPFMLFFYNFPKTNLSNIWIGDTFGKDLFASLPQKSMLFVAGDTTTFNTWYMHYVRGVRPDVRLLNIDAPVGSPYYTTLEGSYKKAHPQAKPSELFTHVIASLPRNGTVFSIEQFQPAYGSKFTWIPFGLVFQLVQNGKIPQESLYTKEEKIVWSQLHVPLSTESLAYGNATIADIPAVYANAMLVTGNFYLSAYKDSNKAFYWFKKAQAVDPNYDKIYASLGIYYLTIAKDCSQAQRNFNKAKTLNPIEPINYLLLYNTYESCLKNPKAAQEVAHAFQKQFDMPISQALESVAKNVLHKK